MIGKTLGLLVSVSVGLLIASQWPDVMRYLKIRQMSQGDGHPENVPVHGTQSYRQP
jgi:hypothetical protein